VSGFLHRYLAHRTQSAHPTDIESKDRRCLNASFGDNDIWDDEFTSSEIEARIRKTKAALKEFGYDPFDVTTEEFYDYMTGPIFSDDPTTLRDVLGNEYIMIHELVEICELKKIGRKIDKNVIMETPKIPYYTAHLNAMETELKYALYKGDTLWAKIRLRQHKESVLDDDPNLPEELRPMAQELYEKYRKLAKQASEQPMTS